MNENEKKLAALEAVKSIRDGQIVGLGTGSTAYFAIEAIGEMVKNGLHIKAVPTSEQSRKLAEEMSIPLININNVNCIDVTIDGADEFTEDLLLVKGGGGALLREKIVASITKLEIIVADSSKKVDKIGQFKIPIEVIPFAENYVLHKIKAFKGTGVIRKKNDTVFVTDQGNHIIDADFGLINDPQLLSDELNTITGVVEHGIFINLAHKIIYGQGNELTVYQKGN